jgi:hypothetical protein
MLYRWGFRWEWWSILSIVLYCGGLMLLIFANHRVMLPLAVVVFICGEVVMTPVLDETAKKHSGNAGMATCLGLLHFIDGWGRLLGAAFALAIYGMMRGTPYHDLYWPVVVGNFLVACLLLQIMAFAMSRSGKGGDGDAGCGEQ